MAPSQLHALSGRILLALALGLAGPAARAAEVPGAYGFRTYGPEQGLRNQAVTSLGQDGAGYLFAGTEDGLFRYDGSRFERFGAAEGLPSDAVMLLYAEPSGRLWVATQKGLVAWDGRKAAPLAPLLPEEQVNQVCASETGRLVVATTRGAFEGGAGGVAPMAGLPQGESAAAWIDPAGTEVLVAIKDRLYRRTGTGAWAARTLAPVFRGEAVQALLRDGRGRIWLRGRRSLWRLAGFDGAGEDLSGKLPGAAVQKGVLALDRLGRVWAPTNLGLVCFADEGATALTDARGLPTQWVTFALPDREGNVWIASEGVHRLLGRMAWTTHTRREKLPSDTVWGVFRTRDGVLWTGTNRGLAKAAGGAWAAVPGTQDRSFYAFLETPDGGFWVGGNNAKGAANTLLYRAPGTSGFRPVPMPSLQGPSIVNSLALGPDGNLYIATQDNGLHRLVRQGAALRGEAVTLPGGDPKEQVNQLLQDARGRLWAAGMAGLACLDGRGWHRFGRDQGLRDGQVEALAADPGGDLWLSYWSVHGLARVRLEAGGGFQVSHLDSPAILTADNIYSLGLDARGVLWLGTAQGVKRWKDGRVDQFGRGEGLPGEDAAANAFWADRNGDVWFGMANGLAHFQAGREAPAPEPSTQVTRVLDGAGRALEAALPEVAWHDRALTFRFSALSFVNEARVRCQVRLAGFEDAWRDTEVREARYTGLPPGRYRFEVRASLGGDRFGPASIREVVVRAPWWRTWWARVLAGVGLAALVAEVFRWRLGLLRRRNAQLEKLVQARTQELERVNEALREASMVDPLTGLKNRRFLGLSMPEELARVSRQRRTPDRSRPDANRDLLFFMVDLDHFKAVNDTHGHAAGDLVLRETSQALRQACREADMVVRWGGEEFLIVARNTDRAAAAVVAENLRGAVCGLRFDLGGGVVLAKTCSIGFAAFPVVEGAPDLFSWEEAVELADQCLYAAKKSGRDAWVGVMVPDADRAGGRDLLHHLPDLAAAGRVDVLASFPEGTPLTWKDRQD